MTFNPTIKPSLTIAYLSTILVLLIPTILADDGPSRSFQTAACTHWQVYDTPDTLSYEAVLWGQDLQFITADVSQHPATTVPVPCYNSSSPFPSMGKVEMTKTVDHVSGTSTSGTIFIVTTTPIGGPTLVLTLTSFMTVQPVPTPFDSSTAAYTVYAHYTGVCAY